MLDVLDMCERMSLSMLRYALSVLCCIQLNNLLFNKYNLMDFASTDKLNVYDFLCVFFLNI